MQVDLVIVGSGFGGSVMAMVARRIGLSVVLLEQGRHPRMTIGNLLLRLAICYWRELAEAMIYRGWRRLLNGEVGSALIRGLLAG